MTLLKLISLDGISQVEGFEMIKRLHIPGYEQARPNIRQAVREGVIEPNGPDGFYDQAELKAVNEWAQSREL